MAIPIAQATAEEQIESLQRLLSEKMSELSGARTRIGTLEVETQRLRSQIVDLTFDFDQRTDILNRHISEQSRAAERCEQALKLLDEASRVMRNANSESPDVEQPL